MEKKSKFLSPLITRDGLNYPKPGTWMRNVSFNKLATLAKNLDTSKSKNHPDKLHSIPTPWARLLLFESALYDKDHPAHEEIRSQWRGLLGLIGLADVLKLGHKLSIPQFSLQAEQSSDLKNAFSVLRPQHIINGKDQEERKWSEFGLIYFDHALLGGTSPRTIVFTGISHQCPANVPFRSEQGRLADPAEYYKTHDVHYLEIIRQWLDHLIEAVSSDAALPGWLGERPSDPNAQPESRHRQLLNALFEWREDLGSTAFGARVIPAGFSRLPAPYHFVKHVERVENGNDSDSDLFLRDHNDVIVCFRPQDDSVLVDAFGNPVTGQTIRVLAGHLIHPGESLPASLDFVPPEIKAIANPIDLFEDTLIEIQVIDSRAVFCLSLGDKNYLLPFRSSINEYFTESEAGEIMRNAHVSQPDGVTIRVQLTIPLVKGKSIRVFKDYKRDESIISNDNLDLLTQELAMWPDFTCPGSDENGVRFFEHYFYYTNDQPKGSKRVQVEFTPLGGSELITRDLPGKGRRWYMSKTPLQAFIGSVKDKRGLLLINHVPVPPPHKFWKVGVDFGSTHTSAFRIEVERRESGKWIGLQDAEIEPIFIAPRVRILTVGDEFQIQENFFLYKAGQEVGHGLEPSITTQLSMPILQPQYYPNDWLPREGQVFLGSLLDSIPNNLHTDLKWNTDISNHSTSAFLRSLQIMVEAEAIYRSARVASVAHAYPTAFPEELKVKQIAEWNAVQRSVGVPVDPNPLSEAVAVCRHLWAEQKALPKANVVSLDVGGSTTDIAFWSGEALRIQGSVKMAAGAAIKYIESPMAEGYRTWFLKKLSQDEPFIGSTIFLPDFPQNRLKRKIYQAALKRLSEDRLMDSFISAIKASASSTPDVRNFLMPILFLFAAVSYYAGLLTRKTNMPLAEEYYLFFCGKGGQLLRWLPGGDVLVQEMFSAGLMRTKANAKVPQVQVRISQFPKEEVGRGLLIERILTVDDKRQGGEMFVEPGATPPVAEEGFEGFQWNEDLTFDKLSRIKDNLPRMSALNELKAFVNAFATSTLTKGISERHGIPEIIDRELYRNTLQQRLSDNLEGGSDSALIEPLFITETKVLIEIMTGQDELFD